MALKALGKVTTNSGTTVRLTNNETDPAARIPCHSVMVQALSGNTGKVYVGTANLNRTSLVGVWAVLPVPTANAIPAFTATVAYAPGALNAADFYIDVDTNGEGVITTVLKG